MTDFRILGPLELTTDNGPVELSGTRQRALLRSCCWMRARRSPEAWTLYQRGLRLLLRHGLEGHSQAAVLRANLARLDRMPA
jgi:hypothetical protein